MQWKLAFLQTTSYFSDSLMKMILGKPLIGFGLLGKGHLFWIDGIPHLIPCVRRLPQVIFGCLCEDFPFNHGWRIFLWDWQTQVNSLLLIRKWSIWWTKKWKPLWSNLMSLLVFWWRLSLFGGTWFLCRNLITKIFHFDIIFAWKLDIFVISVLVYCSSLRVMILRRILFLRGYYCSYGWSIPSFTVDTHLFCWWGCFGYW